MIDFLQPTAEQLWVETQVALDSVIRDERYSRILIDRIENWVALTWCQFMDGLSDLGEPE